MQIEAGETKQCKIERRELLAPNAQAIDKLVAALVRIRSVDTLEGALITRHWLAADMRVEMGELDRLLKLLRWHGLIGLPNEHLVTVEDHRALRAIALASAPSIESERVH